MYSVYMGEHSLAPPPMVMGLPLSLQITIILKPELGEPLFKVISAEVARGWGWLYYYH